jgi:hypothetical protein
MAAHQLELPLEPDDAQLELSWPMLSGWRCSCCTWPDDRDPLDPNEPRPPAGGEP